MKFGGGAQADQAQTVVLRKVPVQAVADAAAKADNADQRTAVLAQARARRADVLAPREGDVAIPSPEERSELLARMTVRYAELTAKRAACEAEIDRLLTKLSSTNSAASESDDRAARIVDLIEGGVAALRAAGDPVGDWRRRLGELRQERSDLSAALEMLKREIEHKKIAVSVEICADLASHHAALARSMIQQLLALHQAHREYIRFQDILDEKGISRGFLPAMNLRFMGHPEDNQSRLAMYLSEAVRDGIMPAEDLPRELAL